MDRCRHRHRYSAVSNTTISINIIVIALLLLQRHIIFITPTESFILLNASMTWQQTWKNILVEGGPKRWKVDDRTIKQQALQTIVSKHSSATIPAAVVGKQSPSQPQTQRSLNILCPLAGDDPFVHEAWIQGHNVTSIDLVPQAVDAMRHQFGIGALDEDWQKKEIDHSIVWHHKPTDRATLYVGDVLQDRPELAQKFDVIYDKDSFGALDKEMRHTYCRRLEEYLKDDGIVYTEVKFKTDPAGRSYGPPFHVDREDLMEASSFGNGHFRYLEGLGEVYSLGMPGMSQTAHILQRLPRTSSSTTS